MRRRRGFVEYERLRVRAALGGHVLKDCMLLDGNLFERITGEKEWLICSDQTSEEALQIKFDFAQGAVDYWNKQVYLLSKNTNPERKEKNG